MPPIPKDRSDLSFAGKTVIVTGANTGLGLAAAIKFAQQGASRIILAVRSIPKGNAAKDVVVAESKAKNPPCKIDVWPLDLLSYQSLHEFATRAMAEIDRLDIVLLNAGVMMSRFEAGAYGWETTLQVNTLSTILLALLLLPQLKASRTAISIPVLEIVGSGMHKRAGIPASRANTPGVISSYNNAEEMGFVGQSQYNRSKLFLQAAVQHIGTHVKPAEDGKPEVYVWAVCPGFVRTELARNAPGYLVSFLLPLVYYFSGARTPEQGSRTFISATALGPEAQGRFYQDDRVHK
jgi:NAD(P)-dependent dehydrogenase (short-subunit alcohol dehydrogenase family)